MDQVPLASLHAKVDRLALENRRLRWGTALSLLVAILAIALPVVYLVIARRLPVALAEVEAEHIVVRSPKSASSVAIHPGGVLVSTRDGDVVASLQDSASGGGLVMVSSADRKSSASVSASNRVGASMMVEYQTRRHASVDVSEWTLGWAVGDGDTLARLSVGNEASTLALQAPKGTSEMSASRDQASFTARADTTSETLSARARPAQTKASP